MNFLRIFEINEGPAGISHRIRKENLLTDSEVFNPGKTLRYYIGHLQMNPRFYILKIKMSGKKH